MSEEYKIKDIGLADSGKNKIEWAEEHMPVLMEIRKEFEETKPLKNLTVGIALHVTKETAVLVRTLIAGGAKISIAGCNPLSTQDDVAAALVSEGVNVYAWRGLSTKEYYECINNVLNHKPNITIDDGCDLVTVIHKERPELIKNIKGGCEETTTGIIRLKIMEKNKVLKYPIIAVNNAMTKQLFDNRYGTGQSTIDGILRATSVLLAGKNVVICGYGWCGKGVATRAKGMGANVIVVEVDPIKALEAAMDGYRVMKIDEAAKIGDVFITVTGNINVIRKEHIENMKDGAILSNSGHFNCEINIKALELLSKNKKKMRENVVKYVLENNKKIYLLAEGRLVNLAAAEGHPSEIMDMSFANQALSVKYIAEHKLDAGIYNVPYEVDRKVAILKLKTMNIEIDELTEEQIRYLDSWEEGT